MTYSSDDNKLVIRHRHLGVNSAVTRDGQKCLNLNLRLNDLLHRHRPSFVQRRSLLLCPKLYQNLYKTHLTQTHHKFMSGWIAKNGRAGFKTTALASPKRIWKVWDKAKTGDAIVSLAIYSIYWRFVEGDFLETSKTHSLNSSNLNPCPTFGFRGEGMFS